MQLSSRQWLMCSKSWISCRLSLSPSLASSSQAFRHPQPSPPSPAKLWTATLQTLFMSMGQSWMRMVSWITLSPVFLEASQVKPMPEKAEYLPARLGYMETQTSSASSSVWAGTRLTTTLSVMTFSMTPKVMGPAGMYASILKLPLFIMAISAAVSCLQMEARNYRYGLCSLRMVLKRRSISFLVKHATFSCLTLNSLYISSTYLLSSASGYIFSSSWLTYLSSISKNHRALLTTAVLLFFWPSSSARPLPFLWTLMMEKFLKSVPLLTRTVSLTCSCTMRWSCPPRIRSMPLTDRASFRSLYFIMCVRAITISHFCYPRSFATMLVANYMKGMYSHISLQQGQRVSIHSFSARLNTPILQPFFSKMQDSRPSASLRWVRLSQMLLSSQGKPVRLARSITWLSSQSRSWLPQQARSMPKACRGLTMFSPSNSEERSEGENASPEKSVSA